MNHHNEVMHANDRFWQLVEHACRARNKRQVQYEVSQKGLPMARWIRTLAHRHRLDPINTTQRPAGTPADIA